MHPDTTKIAEYMREFGSHILGRAIYDATFSEMMRPYAHALAVTLAANGAEIIMKARIAQEHPLLIFSTLPKSNTASDRLTIGELFEYGKTFLYSELPERLWATTGYRVAKIDQYLEFGKLRNMITHFAVPQPDCDDETLKFIFQVIDPMIEDFWGDTIAGYSEYWDEVIVSEGYLDKQLKRIGINELTSTTRKYIDNTMQEYESLYPPKRVDR